MTGRIENETELIQTYLAPLVAGYPGAFGLRDDVAVLSVEPGTDIVVSTDPVIAEVHFFPDDAPADIAWKALACNVSDLIAKGAEPFAYTMALAFPSAPKHDWMSDFARGLSGAQSTFGCRLVGGDTDRTSGPLSISITAFGKVPHGKAVRRATAAAGDIVFVSGTIGDAALGLQLRRDPVRFSYLAPGEQERLLGRYLRPQPGLPIAALVRAFASAALDISDGLIKDAARLANPANCALSIALSDIPLSAAVRGVVAHEPEQIINVIEGGDDYHVLFTVPPNRVGAFEAQAKDGAVQVWRIGLLNPGSGVVVTDQTGNPFPLGHGGYDHFA